MELPENITTINYYFIFDPETFKLSLERDYIWEVCRDVWWVLQPMTLRRRLLQLLSISLCFGQECSLFHSRSCLSSLISSALLFSSCETVSPAFLALVDFILMPLWLCWFWVLHVMPIHCNALFWSPESLRWPIAMGWHPSSWVVRPMLTSSSQELLGNQNQIWYVASVG